MPVQRQLLDVLSQWDDCSADSFSAPRIGHRLRTEQATEMPRMKAALEQTIETEIIPRLLLAHRLASAPKSAGGPTIAEEDVAEFTHLILEHEIAVAAAYVEVLCGRGLPAENVIMELLAPAARRLGYLWEQDHRDFVDVTIGLSRIQHLVRSLSPAFQGDAVTKPEPRHALLIPTPGEQHTLGVMIVEEFFRRSGWQCTSLADGDQAAIAKKVSKQSFDVVGLSTSCEVFIGNTASAIDTVRKNSKNQRVIVIVGGPLFWQRPELVRQVGADGSADDGTQALTMIGSIYAQRLNAKD